MLRMRRAEKADANAQVKAEDEALLDALTWAVLLLLALALARALRDYWRRRGYLSVAQDDRNMFSRVLMGARDSWDNLLGLAAAAEREDARLEDARERNASSGTATTASTTSTSGGG